jgi:hypothetical protein
MKVDQETYNSLLEELEKGLPDMFNYKLDVTAQMLADKSGYTRNGAREILEKKAASGELEKHVAYLDGKRVMAFRKVEKGDKDAHNK